MDKTELRAPGKIEHLGWQPYQWGTAYYLEWSYRHDGKDYSLLWTVEDYDWKDAFDSDPNKAEEEFVAWLNFRQELGLLPEQQINPKANIVDVLVDSELFKSMRRYRKSLELR